MRALLVAAILALCLPAHAGLCKRRDGTYTNHCTDTDDSITGGTVSRGSAAPARTTELQPSANSVPGAAAPDPSGEQESYWHGELEKAQDELRRAEQQLSIVRDRFSSSHCDHQVGGTVERNVLENVLPDRCRRTDGCLPGWVR